MLKSREEEKHTRHYNERKAVRTVQFCASDSIFVLLYVLVVVTVCLKVFPLFNLCSYRWIHSHTYTTITVAAVTFCHTLVIVLL